jgi:hypothetical protein
VSAIIEIQLDSRRRAPLAKVRRDGDPTRYQVAVQKDGTIVLTPVVSAVWSAKEELG